MHLMLGGTPAVADADGAPALEQNAGRMCLRPHVEVGPRRRRTQEGTRRTHPPAALDGPLEIADALLGAAVVVRVARDADADRAVDEGLAERMLPGQILDGERALAPAIGVVALPDPPFGALDVGQQVGIAPATVAHLRPAVIVHALTAIVDVTVDRTRSAEHLAARRDRKSTRLNSSH